MRRVSLLVSAWFLWSGPSVGRQTGWRGSSPSGRTTSGPSPAGSKVHHSFKLVNSTDQEIQIADWRTKCGCTDVRVGAREIPPGTQTSIEAVIDTTKFRATRRRG